MGFVKEFQDFIMKGNVIDLAVGFIIGVAFGKIVTSLVNDIIMPPIGLVLGGVDFKALSMVLKPATETTAAVAINYGAFINTLIDFLIIALVIFVAIKTMNNMRKKFEKQEKKAEEAKKSREEELLEEIRDLLKKK